MVKMAPSVLANGLTQQLPPISRDRPTRNQRILYCTDEVAQAGALSLWKARALKFCLQKPSSTANSFLGWSRTMINTSSSAWMLSWMKA